MEASPVGAAQVLAFQRLLGGGASLDTNARPAQPLNGRAFDYERPSATADSAAAATVAVARA